MEIGDTSEIVSQPREAVRVSDRESDGQERLWTRLVGYKNSLGVDLSKSLTRRWPKPPNLDEGYKRIKEYREALVSDRTFNEISSMHDMTPEIFSRYLAGKEVLDVGVGKSSLSEYLQKTGSSARVTSVDIDFNALLALNSERKVQASAEQLPFADNTFDIMLLTLSLPFWAQTNQQIDQFMSESIRVIKKGGTISITPIIGMEKRPTLTKDPKEIHMLSQLPEFFQTKEIDANVSAATTDMQIHFINALSQLRENKDLKIELIQGYEDVDPKYSIDTIQTYPPSIVQITKL